MIRDTAANAATSGRFFWMALFFLSAVVVLVFLGMWQLERLEWKRNLIVLVEQRQKLDVVPFSELQGSGGLGDHDYQRVNLAGRFINEHSFFLSPRIYNKQSGSHVVTPLRLSDGAIALVNRGWVPQKFLLESAVHSQQVTMVATIRKPARKGTFTPDNNPTNEEWYWLDLGEISEQIGSPILPVVLERSHTIDGPVFPIGDQTVISLPNNHFQYALTWFGLALVFCICFLMYFIRNRREFGVP
jgi:surfeit locus 1 family protein